MHKTAGFVAVAWSLTAFATPISLPCDIYASGETPCVAAHSTTRALFGSFKSALYQITRNSDGATKDIFPLTAGGVADSSVQDSFCTDSTCVISIIYDQTTQGNHLTRAPKGGVPGPRKDGSDYLASTVGAPVTLNGKKAYGVFISPGTGYRNDKVKGTATGDGSEGIYAVLDGTHYNGSCCFDYGNAETSATDTGASHMEALYFGVAGQQKGTGNGPWILADLENGLFSGSTRGQNKDEPSQTSRFVTAIIKGKPKQWAIRGGDASSGSLSTYYSGERPAGYDPMHEEGAIILGIGGDNSNGGQGTFYEGVMTAGYPSDAVESYVQANIVAAGYAAGELNTGSELRIGSEISFRVTTPAYDTRYLYRNAENVDTIPVTSSSSEELKRSASWTVRAGLANSQCYSFESVDTPGSFITQSQYHLRVNKNDKSKNFSEDATYCTQAGLNGKGDSIRSWKYPIRYFRHYNAVGYIASQGGPHDFDSTFLYADDVTFAIGGTSFLKYGP